MVVPLADQLRLSHILADDLQPRIDWAYALEQSLLAIGADFLSVGNGDPNGLVTKDKGDLRIDVTTPALWQNQNGGTVWTDISAGSGGSGLPDPWTADQTTGETTARTDGTDIPPFTVEAVAGQTAPVQVWKDENGDIIAKLMPNGDLLTFPGGGATSSNLSIGDPSNGLAFASFDYTFSDVLRRGGIGLFAATDGYVDKVQVFLDASIVPDGTGRIAVCRGDSANDGHVGFFSFRHDQDKSQISVGANAGQTDPCILVQDENGNDVQRVLPSGAIGTSAGEPADGDINPGECFQYFDPTNGAARLCHKGKTLDGTVVFGFGPMGP